MKTTQRIVSLKMPFPKQEFFPIVRRFSGIATCAIMGASTTVMLLASGAMQSDTSSVQNLVLHAGWRRTKYGWQDSTRWYVESYAPRPSFELIHPLVWAALILFAVIAVGIWASEEWEIARLFRGKNCNDN